MEKQVQPRCAICGTVQQLLRCAKCKTIYYCSIAHQHMDWPTHKQECRLLAKQKNNIKLHYLSQSVTAAESNNTINNYPAMPVLNNPNNISNAYANTESLGNLMTAAESSILKPVQVSSVILGTNENEIMNSQAESVSPSTNIAYHGNVDANSTTMNQMQFCDGFSDCDGGGGGGGGGGGYSSATTPVIMHHQGMNADARMQHLSQQQLSHNTNQSQQIRNHNNQNEKNISCQIGQSDENAIGYLNERRYEELCRNIINDMNQYGLSVVDDFLGVEKGLQILNEVHRMYSAGVFKDGQLVNNVRTEQDLRTIRGDKITWVKGIEPGCSNVGYLINQIDAVICRANTMNNNGKLGSYNIRERTKAMVACYPGSGSHYVMHVDNPNKDGRVITAIYYLNVNWDTERSGGVLRIFPEHGNTIADIEPKFDRLIFFWSDKRNPHEVQPAHRTRYAITVWYFDANEREAALNRCKYVNNVPSSTTTKTATIPETGASSTPSPHPTATTTTNLDVNLRNSNLMLNSTTSLSTNTIAANANTSPSEICT